MRRAFALNNRSRSLVDAPNVIACAAATQVESDAVSVQTGQSLPQTTRSHPKLSIACST
jgi:hypothetical protein